ncbi:beta-galactosidase [Sphingomonas gellani]|uniref:Beta-galactosidase n=1 Tax=Sphingomonas gellani TaxID=1166340 RepID=A0A1H8E0S2_9SPHN|nr:beta-galactosidase GalA [Sphingomonas gellani]SEN12388.1 beta-galactosidase [Sphingomonas gellani]
MNRRSFLLSGAAAVALAGPAPFAMARGRVRAGGAGALPMPSPLAELPVPLPLVDPARVRLEQGWVFHAGDVPVPPPANHHDTYLSVKAGNAPGAAAPAFDDSDWAPVRLPHDWAATQPFVQSANVSQGYRPRGIGWYRRVLTLDPADRGKRIELHFDGIATHATVWINGSEVAHSWSGYSAVVIDMTPFARFGDEENVIAIRVDAEAMEGWWYEGAGLYRHTWLVRRAPVAIATDGVHCDPRAGPDGWQVPVDVTLDSVARDVAGVTVQAQLLDATGRAVAHATTDVVVTPLDQARAALMLDAGGVALWSVERPTLYTVLVHVIRDGETVDERRVPVGFRSIRFDADRGFLLNDRSVKLKGVCLHQDHAGVGVAVPDTLLEWRLGRLKAMGCNAIRCSHGAPAAELLHLADRMGFLVMNENRRFNPAPDYLAQLQWLVRRDRNHPSVILWSVFNEEPMQGSEAGVEMVRRMVHAVKALDDSRPVTAAMNGAFLDPVSVSAVVDVTGFNYYQNDYDRFHRAYPGRPMTSSEDTSAYETRGAYASDPARHVITSYDTEVTSWGDTHRATWRKIAERPFVAGGFVWTGFDYHGEPTPYDWPTISSFFGILDLCGFPKTAFDIRSAQWVDDRAVVAIAPHWTWPGREGQPIRVAVSCNAETVTLIVNGKAIGTQAVDRVMGNEWSVPYAPGRIEAVARAGGRIVAVAVHETIGDAVALRLTPARTIMAGDGEDVQPVTVDAVDAAGRHVPTANLAVHFSVAGAAIIGLGNGDPNSHEPEQGDARSLFNGLAQVILRAGLGEGRVVLTAAAPGLRPARLTIDCRRTAPVPRVAATPRVQRLLDWRRSPAFASRPSPDLAPTDGDNNSWAFVQPGVATRTESAGEPWRLYRTAVTPWRRVAAEGGVLRFEAVAGRAELWIDGRKLADKASADPAPLVANLPPATGRRLIVLLVEVVPGAPSGLLGPVTLAARAAG